MEDKDVDAALVTPEYRRWLPEVMSSWKAKDFEDSSVLPVLMHFVQATILAHVVEGDEDWEAVDRAAALATQAQIVWEKTKFKRCCNFNTRSSTSEYSPLMMVCGLDLEGVGGRGAEMALSRVVEVMLQREDIDLFTGTESQGKTTLYIACQKGHEACVLPDVTIMASSQVRAPVE